MTDDDVLTRIEQLVVQENAQLSTSRSDEDVFEALTPRRLA